MSARKYKRSLTGTKLPRKNPLIHIHPQGIRPIPFNRNRQILHV